MIGVRSIDVDVNSYVIQISNLVYSNDEESTYPSGREYSILIELDGL